MAFPDSARKHPARRLASPLLTLLLLGLGLHGCGGPSAPAIDLESEPEGTDREQLRTAMAQERPLFFETREGERFYGSVRRTTDEGFVLAEKHAFEGEQAVPLSDRTEYAYAEIARALPVPEEGNSTQGFVLGTTLIALAILGVMAFFVVFPIPSS